MCSHTARGFCKRKERGFSLLELLYVVLIVVIIASLAIPRMLESKKAANESSAIASLRTIIAAQIAYSSTVGNGNYAPDLARLADAQLIDTDLGTSARNGYLFSVGETSERHFTVTAAPADEISGSRYFFSDESAVIRVSSDGPANSSSPSLNSGGS